MERKLGLYVTLGNDGSLKRTSVSISGETELDATTLNDEVILFSELIFDFYAFIVDRIRLSAAYLVTQDGDGKDTVDMRVFEFIQDAVQDLIEEFEEDDPLYGTLTRTIMEDRIPIADGSDTYPVTAVEKIISELSAVMLTQFSVNNILRDMRFHVPVDLDKKYRSLQEVEFTQISSFSNLHTPEYLFRSAADYYTFLVLHFIAAEPRVALCECCGRYFIPKTAKKTLYCDRVLKDDKTCKDLGPALKHIVKCYLQTIKLLGPIFVILRSAQVNLWLFQLDLRIERKLHSFFLLGVVPKEMPLIRLILQNTFYAFLGKTSPESYSCRRRL